MSIAICTTCLNEMQWLPKLYEQHRNWPDMVKWVFVESADVVYAEANPGMVNPQGLSVDGTSEFLSNIAGKSSKVTYIPYGFSNGTDRAQCKCEAMSAYLRALDDVRPDYFFMLDADEFYTYSDQNRINLSMNGDSTCFRYRHRHIWRPPSVSNLALFTYEVVGGFWTIPLCRGWKWFPDLIFLSNHNTPETQSGDLLDSRITRYDEASYTPECIHMAWASDIKTRQAKHRYYEARGEGRTDFRGWYVESRAASETWQPGDSLPYDAKVVPYTGPIPECF